MSDPSWPKRPPLDRGAQEPVHAQIEGWLTSAISAGHLRPGDRLPAERELAVELGVSRMTLRQALASMESRGVIVRVTGRAGGAFVAEPRIELDLTGLTGFTEQLRRANLRAGARVLHATTVPSRPEIAAALGIKAGDPVHEVVRIRSARRAPVALERSFFPAGLFPDLLQRSLSGSLYALLRTAYGHEPVRATEHLDCIVADQDAAMALDLAPGAALMRVERTAFDRGGTPVEFARDLFRGDRVRLLVRTTEPG